MSSFLPELWCLTSVLNGFKSRTCGVCQAVGQSDINWCKSDISEQVLFFLRKNEVGVLVIAVLLSTPASLCRMLLCGFQMTWFTLVNTAESTQPALPVPPSCVPPDPCSNTRCSPSEHSVLTSLTDVVEVTAVCGDNICDVSGDERDSEERKRKHRSLQPTTSISHSYWSTPASYPATRAPVHREPTATTAIARLRRRPRRVEFDWR